MKRLLPVLMVFGVFLGSSPLSISVYAAKPLVKCRTVSGVVEVPSVEACQNWAMGTPLPKSYGDFDGVWAGPVARCHGGSMYPTVRIEIVGDTVRLYNFGDHVRSDSEILSGVAAKFYVGKIQLEDGFFSSKGDFKISGTERIKEKIYNFETGR